MEGGREVRWRGKEGEREGEKESMNYCAHYE